jgi:hypothetical protein
MISVEDEVMAILNSIQTCSADLLQASDFRDGGMAYSAIKRTHGGLMLRLREKIEQMPAMDPIRMAFYAGVLSDGFHGG